MTKLTPYLHINDNKCREAMTFYKDCLGGGELTFQTVGDSPMAKEMPKESHAKIMHSTLKKDDFMLLAGDMMRDKAIIGDNVALALDCENEKELMEIFSK